MTRTAAERVGRFGIGTGVWREWDVFPLRRGRGREVKKKKKASPGPAGVSRDTGAIAFFLFFYFFLSLEIGNFRSHKRFFQASGVTPLLLAIRGFPLYIYIYTSCHVR